MRGIFIFTIEVNGNKSVYSGHIKKHKRHLLQCFTVEINLSFYVVLCGLKTGQTYWVSVAYSDGVERRPDGEEVSVNRLEPVRRHPNGEVGSVAHSLAIWTRNPLSIKGLNHDFNSFSPHFFFFHPIFSSLSPRFCTQTLGIDYLKFPKTNPTPRTCSLRLDRCFHRLV